MILELAAEASTTEISTLIDQVARHDDVTAWPVRFGDRAFLVVSGDEDLVPELDSPIVTGRHLTHPSGYWLVDRAHGVAPRQVRIGDSVVGGGGLWTAAGPCALESVDDAIATGKVLAAAGVNAFRAGVWKPRTGPYNFQGKGRIGLPVLREVRAAIGLPVVSEVLDPRDVEPASEVLDCLQVGTRNMTNQALLKELGNSARPVLLKRGANSPIVEWIRAAEFVAAHGNLDIVLCARGISSFDTSLRSMPDVSAIHEVRRFTDLPVIFDPSHSAGKLSAVTQVAVSAAAFGTDGFLIESHIAPERTHKPGDGPQAYPPDRVGALVATCLEVRGAVQTLMSSLDR